jgi:SulP family sulfate permease
MIFQVIGVMLIPQGMAYSMLAGLPPIYGLYASIVPLLVYAVFGTSRQLAVGPVAMVSLMVASGVGAIAPVGSPEFISMAILMALMVGLFQFFLGAFRLGFLVNFLSHPVISGFTSAAALIIGLSQLKHLLGLDLERSKYIHKILIDAASNISHVHVPTLLIGVGGIALILGLKKINKKIPGPLIAVIFGILAVWLGGLADAGVKIVGEVPKGLPAIKVPEISWENMELLIPGAIAISLVSFMESIAVAKAIQAKHRNYKVDSNQELIGLGLANIFGSFTQAFPTTGGFSRTAVNDQSGAKTGLASIISAVLIALTLLFLTPLFYFLPKAILASVIMVAVFGLIDFKEVKHLWKTDKTDLAMLLITFVATLSLGIEEGIGLGLAVSLMMVVYRSSRPHVATLGHIPDTHYYRNIKRFPDATERKDAFIFRLDSPLYYANVEFFKETVEKQMEKRDNLKLIIMNAAAITSIDSTALHALHELVVNTQKQGITVLIAGCNGPLRDRLEQVGFKDQISGDGQYFLHVQDAIDYYDKMALRKQNSNQTASDSKLETA